MIGPKTPRRGEKLHQVTFCQECGEAIPAKALACFRCGARQKGGEKVLRVVFCETCGLDYPAKALACFHCGHLNPHHPLVADHGAA
ncbi:MAG: double zinc ribbon domain-containing protein [Planctomycetota bacterium]